MSRNQRRNRRNKSGASQTANRNANRNAERSVGAAQYRPSTETKSSLRTTELIAYAGAVLAVVMTALAVDADGDGNDPFGAEPAIRYITYLTIGYMIDRGLAKAGSYENRVERADALVDDDADHAGVTADGPVAGDDDAHRWDGDVETVDAQVAPSDEMENAGTAKADAKP